MSRLFSLLLVLSLTSCTGYRLGGAKPPHLAEVDAIQVEMVENKTQFPRLAAQATNSIIDALTQDGTYRLAAERGADARLEAVIQSINYRQARSSRTDTLRSEELEMDLTLKWKLLNNSNPGQVLASGTSRGQTRFFVDPNLATARRTALMDALKRASESVVARIADGF